jgi:hypothetical protein
MWFRNWSWLDSTGLPCGFLWMQVAAWPVCLAMELNTWPDMMPADEDLASRVQRLRNVDVLQWNKHIFHIH